MRTTLTVKERLKPILFPDVTVNIVDNPVEIVFRLPERIFMSNDPTEVKIGVWDADKKMWSIDCIAGDCKLKPETRTIEFTTTKFSPIAMLQSRCTDYPYVNWWLRCVDPETCLLDLTTKRMKLIFEIGALHCRLIECQIPELSHLKNKEFTPGYLLKELQKCGIHLMPKDDDAKLAGIELKDRSAEERAILDVACAVRAIHFRKARWNQGVQGHEGIGQS